MVQNRLAPPGPPQEPLPRAGTTGRVALTPMSTTAPSTGLNFHGPPWGGRALANASTPLGASPWADAFGHCYTPAMEPLHQDVECVHGSIAAAEDLECLRAATAIESAVLSAERQWLQLLNA